MDETEQNEINDPTGENDYAGGDEILNLSTDELESPTRKPDAYRGHITSVEAIESREKGTPGIQVNLYSDDGGFDDKLVIWVPRPWAENIRISPLDLSEGTFNPETKKKEGDERTQFAIGIHNKKNDATVDTLRTIARNQGRSLEGAEPLPEEATIEDFCDRLNTLLSDVQVVVRRRPQKDNPRFLQVQDILDISTVEDAKSQRLFRGYQLSWQGVN